MAHPLIVAGSSGRQYCKSLNSRGPLEKVGPIGHDGNMSRPAHKTKSQIRSSGAIRRSDSARELLAKTGRALAKPGISKASVFGVASKKVFAYSVYSKDPTKIVRQAADGKKTIGRLVAGKFRAS